MRKTSHRVGGACVLWLAAAGWVPTFDAAAAVLVNLEWAVKFRPPGSSRCEAVGLAVEADTGRSFVTGTNYPAKGTGAEFLTVACDRNGARLWTAAWARPGGGSASPLALAFDAGANRLCLAGQAMNRKGGNIDTAIVAYDTSGRQLWTRLQNQAAGGWDLVGMGLDPLTANLYLLGADYARKQTVCSFGVITLDHAGKRLWAEAYEGSPKGRWEPRQIAVDPASGDVLVAGSACDYAAKAKTPTYGAGLVAWDAAGILQWAAHCPGPEGSVFSRVTVDAATGAVYVCGNTGGGGMLLVAAYSADGEELWADTRFGAASGHREAVAMALDAPVGNLYVTGTELDPATGKTAWFTLAYNLTGTLRWTARHAVGGNAGSGPVALAVDEGRARLYVTGRVAASAIETVAYDAAGNLLWTARYADPGGAACDPVAIATDAAGNAYIAGTTLDKAGSGGFLILKYAALPDPDTDRDQLPDEWEMRYFGNLSRDGSGDFDRDGLTESEEFAAGTNPVCADTDIDGMPDGWEVRHGLNPVSDDAAADPDGDGVSSGTEYLQGRNPARGAVPDTANAVALKLFTLLE